MKKYFFMALLASLFILLGCKKESKTDPTPTPTPDPDPVVSNTVIEKFDFCKDFIGGDSAAIASILLGDGYEVYGTVADAFTVSKVSDGLMTMIGVLFEDNRAIEVNIMMGDAAGQSDICEGETFWEVMVYMGESYSFSDKTWPFQAIRYKEGGQQVTVEDYSVALENIKDISDNGDVKLLWAEGKNGVMFTKEYSEKEKREFVSILIL